MAKQSNASSRHIDKRARKLGKKQYHLAAYAVSMATPVTVDSHQAPVQPRGVQPW